MKITEATTLAELQEYLKACGNPFVTLMANPSGNKFLHAIVHAPDVGTFHGGGSTVAEALEAAFIGFRRATLPEASSNGSFHSDRIAVIEKEHRESLAIFAKENRGLQAEIERLTAGNKFRQHADELCHGCSHTSDEHPNDTGCQSWHDKP